MSELQIVYSKEVGDFLYRAEKAVAKRIVTKLQENAGMPDPLARAKALQGTLSGMYRYRVGQYRVIFEYEKDNTVTILYILKVGHRKNIYR